MTKMVDCPRCGGMPDYDEDGRPFTCFCCCDTGLVPEAVAAAELRAHIDAEEAFAPTRLGIFERPMLHEYDWADDWDTPRAPGHRLFTRLIPANPVKAPVIAWEDIPF